MTLDIDGPSVEVFVNLIYDGTILQPNCAVTRLVQWQSSCVVVFLKPCLSIVARHARPKPLAFFRTVGEYYRWFTQADPGYTGVRTHNPLWTGSELYTWWGHKGGYSLGDLASIIPTGWKIPPHPTTNVGRNCWLFEHGCKLAGSPHHQLDDVLPLLQVLNNTLSPPLGVGEVHGIARSIQKYRDKWDFYQIDLDYQRARQAAGVWNRNNKSEDLHFQIALWHLMGWSYDALAKAFQKNRKTIRNAVYQFRVVTCPVDPAEESFRDTLSGEAGILHRSYQERIFR